MGALENLNKAWKNFVQTINNYVNKDPFFKKKLAQKERATERARRRSQRNNRTVKVTPHGRQYRVRRVQK